MRIDCHFHLDESMVSVQNLIAGMDRYGIEKTALMGALNDPLHQTLMTKHGTGAFRRAMTSRMGWLRSGARSMYSNLVKDDGSVDVGGRRYRIKPQPDNGPVMDAVRENPDRFYGWVFINPAGPADAVEELERCMKQEGMIGAKAHPYWHSYKVEKLKPAAEYCEKKGLPMIIHLGTGKKGDYKLLPEYFRDLKVIYAHAGIPYHREVWEYIRLNRNVHLDLSSTAYVDLRIAKEAVETVGAQNLMFGTDGPYFHVEDGMFDPSGSIHVTAGLYLSEKESRLIERENFERIISG